MLYVLIFDRFRMFYVLSLPLQSISRGSVTCFSWGFKLVRGPYFMGGLGVCGSYFMGDQGAMWPYFMGSSRGPWPVFHEGFKRVGDPYFMGSLGVCGPYFTGVQGATWPYFRGGGRGGVQEVRGLYFMRGSSGSVACISRGFVTRFS
jgi:hypothetical protein